MSAGKKIPSAADPEKVQDVRAAYLYLADVARALSHAHDPDAGESDPRVEPALLRLADAWVSQWSLSSEHADSRLKPALKRLARDHDVAPAKYKRELVRAGLLLALAEARQPSPVWIGRARVFVREGRPVLVKPDGTAFDYHRQECVGPLNRAEMETTPLAPAEADPVLPLPDLARWLRRRTFHHAGAVLRQEADLRDRNREPEPAGGSKSDDLKESHEPDPVTSRPDPTHDEAAIEAHLLTNEARRQAGCSDPEWTAVYLVDWCGYSYREAGEEMGGIAEGTVGAHLHRGRKKIARWREANAV